MTSDVNFIKESIDKTFFALGTVNMIKINDCDDVDIIEKAVQRVLEIDDRMSAFKKDSDITRIKENAGKGFTEVHEETFHLIKKAVEYGELSKGVFDITMRPLINLWGINQKDNYIPNESEIQEVLQLVNFREILLEEKSLKVALKRPGQAIDLGGIAKGYAADEVKKILLNNGVRSALINLGGNVLTIGNKADGQEWKIGLQNPMAPTGEYLGILTASDRTIVTSGSNERFFMKEGVRYHHILDPRTGHPAQSDLLSVTVICESSVDADAITTALFILGLDESIELIQKLGVEFVFIKNNMEIIYSNGLKDNFILIE